MKIKERLKLAFDTLIMDKPEVTVLYQSGYKAGRQDLKQNETETIRRVVNDLVSPEQPSSTSSGHNSNSNVGTAD